MYLKFFGLTKKPFHTTPDPSFLFLTPSHKEALGAMLYSIDHRKGFAAIIGEVGVGKTTIVRSFLEQVDWHEERTHLIYLYNPTLTVSELLKYILSELDQEYIGKTDAQLVQQLQECLIEKYRQGGTVVLLIDEAQNMLPKTLEHLRMLSNLETSTDKLIQIILIGQPELETVLQQHELRQLRQRIAVWATIRSLSEQESFDYITHRLVVAGLTEKHIFQKSALALIVKQAEGIPRRINILCDNALITAVGYRMNPISAKIVKEVISDIDKQAPKRRWSWIPATAGVLFFLFSAAMIVVLDAPQTIQNVKQEHLQEEFIKTQGSHERQTLLTKNENQKNPVTTVSTNTGRGAKTPVTSVSQPLHLERVTSDETVGPSMNPKPEVPGQGEALATDTTESVQDVFRVTTSLNGTSVINPKDHTEGSSSPRSLFVSTQNTQGELPEESPEGPLKKSRHDEASYAQEQSHSTPDPQTRIIQRGDTLAELMMEVYGSSDSALLEFVLKHNPTIKHVRKIIPGQRITFPQLKNFAREEFPHSFEEVKTTTTNSYKNGLATSKVIFTKSAEASRQRPRTEQSVTKPLTSRIIQDGDSLSRLVKSIYGSTDPEHIKLVLKYNPHIQDARRIFPGQKVLFPNLSEAGEDFIEEVQNP